MRGTAAFCTAVLTAASIFVAQGAETMKKPVVKVIEGGEPSQDYRTCRRMLVGPGINEPAPFPGWGGFVGWEAPIRLRNGTWLVGFNAGYWHASPPTPFTLPPATIAAWEKLGMPTDVDAPRGGRAMLIRSTDEGVTWSRPETLIDTPWDDRHPNFCELSDGTILCSFFTYPGGRQDPGRDPSKTPLTGIIRSFDGGKTWEQTPKRLDGPFTSDSTDGPIIELPDGSALLAVSASPVGGGPDVAAIYRTTDRGETWELLSTVKSENPMYEPSIARLPDGRLVLIARPEGDIAWSDDGGKTWTDPVTFGIRLFEPGLICLRDGTLLCLHGSYGAGGFRAMFSTDGGMTWLCPAKDYAFPVDPSVYGYAKGIELPDGSVFAVYINTGGHRTEDAKSNAIWGIRLRVRPDYSGIDLLPAPGLPGADEPPQG